MASPAQRYTAVAIVLHWAIAIAILLMIPLGWWMGDALEAPETQAQAIAAFQLHKSVGLTVLALSIVRLGWRLANPAPPLPEGMKAWERAAATATHWGFYVVMLALPLTGWLYVSTGWSVHDNRPLEVPTVYFGLFQAPHLFGLSHLADDARASLAGVLEFGHSKLAWGAIALTVLHVAAALKHQFADRDGLLGRMVPGLSRAGEASAGRAIALAGGFAAIAVALAAAVWAFASPPASAPPSTPPVVEEIAAPETPAAPDASEPGNDNATAPAPADGVPAWTVDRGASSIAFTGVWSGAPFEGRFSRWRADIRFDPGDLDRSSAAVVVDTASASVAAPFLSDQLPLADGFDVANHPSATFRTGSIRARGDGAYEANGVLTIKGRQIDARLPFTLRIEGARAVMDGAVTIAREDANLGMSSDPSGEYLSREITVRVHVEATRAQ
jgi:cytochrome b561